MVIIPIFSSKSSKKKPQIVLFFRYSSPADHLAHLYEHLLDKEFSKIKEAKIVYAGVGSGLFKLHIECSLPLDMIIKNLLLEKVSSRDFDRERKRIVLETLTKLKERRWVVHLLIQYQKQNVLELENFLKKFLKKKIKKEEIFQGLKLTHVIFVDPKLPVSYIKKKIINFGNHFSGVISKPKAISLPERFFLGEDFIYIFYSIALPIKDIIEAYQAVFLSRLLFVEIDQSLREKGIIYSGRLEMCRDFSPKIFITFIFPILSEDKEKGLKTIKQVITSPLRRKDFFQIVREKLLREIKRKVGDPLKEAEDLIAQEIEWGTSHPFSMNGKIKMIKKINFNNFCSWWEKKKDECDYYCWGIE
jgi:hypothetical protein